MTIYFAADHHFQHKNILNFVNEFGNHIRPGFVDIDEHDEFTINSHNTLVDPSDTIYFLGDVTWKFNNKAKELIGRMNGTKYLVGGNHDDLDWLMGTGLFAAHYTWKYFPEHGIIASHFPIHDSDFNRAKYNIHGHIHDNTMRTDDGKQDFRYLNVSMERIGHMPVPLEEAINYFKG